MRLWIDDVRPMPDDFDVHAKTYDQAILQLSTGKVTHASFDHDLGMEISSNHNGIMAAKEDKTAKTGYDIAKWVEEQAYYKKIPKFTWSVHSDNPTGKARIIQALLNANKFWNMDA